MLSYQSESQRDELRARVDVHLTHGVHRFLFDHLFLVRLLTLAIEGPRSLHHIQFVQPSAAELGIDDATRRSRAPALERALDDLERIARELRLSLRGGAGSGEGRPRRQPRGVPRADRAAARSRSWTSRP